MVVLLWHGTASELGKVGVCGAVQRVSKGQHLNPVCQQVDILHSISYLSYSDRLKWELFPMKNDHKSFPFHDFNLAFFLAFGYYPVLPSSCYYSIVSNIDCMSHCAAKFRIPPGNVQALLSTLSPNPLGITQASSRFCPKVLTTPPEVLFVVKPDYYKTS